MGFKTALPGLLKVLRKTCGFILSNDSLLRTFIPDEHIPKLEAVVTACRALEEVVVPLVPNDF